MSDTYGAMGDLSWDEIYTVAMEQYTKGINLLIPHAVWYDDRHVTFKPELSWRHPGYAPRLPEFNTYLARLNLLLQNDAAQVADLAVLYPIATLQGSHHLDGPLGHYQGGVTVPEADYVDVGELLAVNVGRDYTYLHPDVLDERCVIEGDKLVLPNRIHPGRFTVMVLPGHQTIRWSSLQKIQAFCAAGGRVIATGQLPSKSAEFGHDPEVTRVVQALFGASDASPAEATPFTVRHHDRGGVAIHLKTLNADTLRAALDAARADYDVNFPPGGALRYLHKQRDGRHVFFLANLDPKLTHTKVSLRGRHDLESWDPHTGTIGPLPSKHVAHEGTEFTEVELTLPYLRSLFLVSAAEAAPAGSPHQGTPAPVPATPRALP